MGTEKKLRLFVLMLIIPSASSFGQNCLSLDEVIALNKYSRKNEIIQADSLINEDTNRMYHIRYLPRVNFSATLPGLTKNILPITREDGSEVFSNRFYMTSSMSLSFSQSIPWTGGTVYANTGINRLDNFLPMHSAAFSMNIFNLSYSQSLSFYNNYKYEKELQERTVEAKKIDIIVQKIDSEMTIINDFFELLTAYRKMELDKLSAKYSEDILIKTRRLFDNGRLSDIDLLNAEIAYQRQKNSIAELGFKQLLYKLQKEISLDEVDFIPVFPVDTIEKMSISFDEELLIERALHFGIELQRRIDEIKEEQTIKQLNSDRLPHITFSIGVGSASSSTILKNLIDSPSRTSSASVTISFPILDWGERKLKYNVQLSQIRKSQIEYLQDKDVFIATLKYELNSIPVLIGSIVSDGKEIEMQNTKLERIIKNVDFGKIDFVEIEATERQIKQVELSRLGKIQDLYRKLYWVKKVCLYDIIVNKSVYS